MTTCLVTGARGFVGRSLLPQLADKGIQATAITRELHGDENPAAQWIALTIGPKSDWSDALKDVDAVIHLADGLRAYEKPDKANPPDAAALMQSTITLAQQAESAGVKRFIYVSSIKAAAGETSKRALVEFAIPNPGSQYGEMKLQCEKLLAKSLQQAEIELIIIRNPIVYGPGATNNMARLLSLADTPWPLPFKGHKNARSIISAKNLGHALSTVVAHEGSAEGTYFIHDGNPLSTGEMIGALRDALGRPTRQLKLPRALWQVAAVMPGVKKLARRLSGSLTVSGDKFHEQFSWQPVETSHEGLTAMAKAHSDPDLEPNTVP